MLTFGSDEVRHFKPGPETAAIVFRQIRRCHSAGTPPLSDARGEAERVPRTIEDADALFLIRLPTG